MTSKEKNRHGFFGFLSKISQRLQEYHLSLSMFVNDIFEDDDSVVEIPQQQKATSQPQHKKTAQTEIPQPETSFVANRGTMAQLLSEKADTHSPKDNELNLVSKTGRTTSYIHYNNPSHFPDVRPIHTQTPEQPAPKPKINITDQAINDAINRLNHSSDKKTTHSKGKRIRDLIYDAAPKNPAPKADNIQEILDKANGHLTDPQLTIKNRRLAGYTLTPSKTIGDLTFIHDKDINFTHLNDTDEKYVCKDNKKQKHNAQTEHFEITKIAVLQKKKAITKKRDTQNQSQKKNDSEKKTQKVNIKLKSDTQKLLNIKKDQLKKEILNPKSGTGSIISETPKSKGKISLEKPKKRQAFGSNGTLIMAKLREQSIRFK